MKTIMIMLVGLGVVGVAQAVPPEPVFPFEWNRATVAMIDNADATRGAAIAEQARCGRCHGDAGIAEDDDSPSIAGQVVGYQFKQLVDYHTGVRDNRDMSRALRDLGLQDLVDLAAYYATLPGEAQMGTGEPPALVSVGDKSRLLIGCNSCHGANGEGMGYEVPSLSGQKINYFLETMYAFRDGERRNDEYARMRYIASQLTDQEIQELANWYAAKPLD